MDSKFHTFTVMGTERPHVVTLFQRTPVPALPLQNVTTFWQPK